MAGIRYLVTCKDAESLEPAKKFIESQGGKIMDTFKITTQGFDVEMPKDTVSTLEANEHITAVELLDGEVRTQ